MASDDWNNLFMSLKRKRAIEEEESRKKMKIIVGAITSVITIVLAWYTRNFFVKEPSRDWDRERCSYLNRLYNGTEVDCIEQLRVSKSAFKKLCKILHDNGRLARTRNVSIEESVAIFLNILAHNHKIRSIGFDYYRSKETISRQFNRVLQAMLRISKNYLKYQSPIMSGSDKDKWKRFENCLGALDGTHIHVTVSADEKTKISNNPFQVPSEKYYLVDAGYSNGPGFLAPYRGTRYHLNEWTGNRPRNYKELFNLRHSSARNVIERAFGLLKKRWSILRTSSFFNIKTQIRIINACCTLHNFIRIEQLNDSILEDQDLMYLASVDADIANQPPSDQNNFHDRITCVETNDQWTAFRDTLALKMFQDYQARRLPES
ncbi:hypothetical protein M0R45_019881 [Rubus argutus]|uniref:DDE Tnp4 domain-containing protein n=1 Tax=Rubus argutus TaxID=59490 RepID=A0AAW1X6Q2_RUBAR